MAVKLLLLLSLRNNSHLRDCLQGKRQDLNNSDVDFADFNPAGAKCGISDVKFNQFSHPSVQR